MIIEDMDQDNFEKRVVPVALQTGGYVSLYNGGKSWKDDGYLRKRNIFFTTVATGREYDLAFDTTNPESLRYLLPNHARTDKVRVGIFYSNPQRLIVKFNKRYMRDINPSGYDFRSVIRPTADMPCGSNAYVGW